MSHMFHGRQILLEYIFQWGYIPDYSIAISKRRSNITIVFAAPVLTRFCFLVELSCWSFIHNLRTEKLDLKATGLRKLKFPAIYLRNNDFAQSMRSKATWLIFKYNVEARTDFSTCSIESF